MLYATTKHFLETFDLPALTALPTVEEMEKLMPVSESDENKLF
jgi:chromosome segregation and condensation protein ScpB